MIWLGAKNFKDNLKNENVYQLRTASRNAFVLGCCGLSNISEARPSSKIRPSSIKITWEPTSFAKPTIVSPSINSIGCHVQSLPTVKTPDLSVLTFDMSIFSVEEEAFVVSAEAVVWAAATAVVSAEVLVLEHEIKNGNISKCN